MDAMNNNLQNDQQILISSKDILNKTGISRGTLNNYIKFGILPRPSIKTPTFEQEKAKKIGYFPLIVLDIISTVKRMKKEGLSMEEIIREMGRKTSCPDNIVESESNVIFMNDADVRINPDSPSLQRENDLGFTLENIHTPAYLLNYKFEIEWINSEAEEKIFHQPVRVKKFADARNIFKLLFNWEVHSSMTNWEKFVDFHVNFLKMGQADLDLKELYSDISEKEYAFLASSYERVDGIKKEIIKQSAFSFKRKDGSEDSYKVYTVFFREGMFFFYEPCESATGAVPNLLLDRGKVIKDLLQQRLPTLVPFSVLVADLQDSCRISAELLPEEYFKLIKQIYMTMEESFKKYYGVYGKHAGDGMVYYFLKEHNSNYLLNALSCAKEIQQKMESLSAEWMVLKKWQNELYLNIGITEGEEFFGTIPSSNNIEFTALGDTINFAARLSGMARYGSIITTKNLINKLKEEERSVIRFGIRKKMQDREIFIENTFSRAIDFLPANDLRREKFMDSAALIITEIVR